jgi:hypothetical protein
MQFDLQLTRVHSLLFLLTDLLQTQLLLQLAYSKLVLLTLLIEGEVIVDLPPGNGPLIIIFELANLTLQFGDGAFVVVVLRPQFALEFEYGLIVVLDCDVQVVDDVLGLTRAADRPIHLFNGSLGVYNLTLIEFTLLLHDKRLQFLVFNTV